MKGESAKGIQGVQGPPWRRRGREQGGWRSSAGKLNFMSHSFTCFKAQISSKGGPSTPVRLCGGGSKEQQGRVSPELL